MFVHVALDSRLPVGRWNSGMVVAPVFPRREREELDVVLADIPKGGVDGGGLKGATVLQEEAVHLVCGGVFTHRDAVVR